jgi:hypothetical protein
MKDLINLSFMPLFLLSIITCSDTFASKFNYKNVHLLELNKTTINDALKYFGTPVKRSNESNDDGTFEVIRFVCSAVSGYPPIENRLLVLEFKNGVLNAFLYNSVVKDEQNNFNYDNYTQIIKGETNKEKVISLLGTPSGKAICPSILEDYKDKCKNSTEIWTWLNTTKIPDYYNFAKIKGKSITVSFDNNGVVTNIESIIFN